MSYREYPPPERLARGVECFWALQITQRDSAYPVLPDGCVDIVLSRPGDLRVVGTMSRPHHFDLAAGQFVCGVRFRPGHSYAFVPVPGRLLTDRTIPLRDVWGGRADSLHRRMEEGPRPLDLLASSLEPASLGGVQRLIDWLAQRHGEARMDDLAQFAGLSTRQLRRLFLEQTGLTPKHFCRVLRFRHALSRLRRNRGEWAGLAAACGYYDQAHLIRDFHEFAGVSPSNHVRFFQSSSRIPAVASGHENHADPLCGRH